MTLVRACAAVGAAIAVAASAGGVRGSSHSVASAATVRNGLIAYTAGGLDAGSEPPMIWVVNPDGTGDRSLNASGGFVAGVSAPRWSRDGKRLLFFGWQAWDDPLLGGNLWYTTAAGRRLTEIPLPGTDVAGYDWAPDGRHVVVSITRGSGVPENSMLYTMALDGTHRKRLHRGAYPSWSGDGRFIVFTSAQRRSLSGDTDEIGIIRANGTGFRTLTKSHHDRDPAFSPGGTKVLFTRGLQWRIINVNGRNDRLVKTLDPSLPAETCPPQWTPDGKRLAAIRKPHQQGSASLVTFNLAGGDERVAFTFPREPGCSFSWQRRR